MDELRFWLPRLGEACGDPFHCDICRKQAQDAGLLSLYLREQTGLMDAEPECDDEGWRACHALP